MAIQAIQAKWRAGRGEYSHYCEVQPLGIERSEDSKNRSVHPNILNALARLIRMRLKDSVTAAISSRPFTGNGDEFISPLLTRSAASETSLSGRITIKYTAASRTTMVATRVTIKYINKR